MATDIDSPNSTRKSSIFKKLGVVLVVAALLLVALYFVVTSSGFFRSVILPKVSEALNAKATVESAKIRPFSGVTLQKFELRTTGAEPVVSAERVEVRYRLSGLLGGKKEVESIRLVGPVISVVQEVDGSSNLDPILQSKKDEKAEMPDEKGTTQFNLKDLQISNGTLKLTSKRPDGGSQVTEVKSLELALQNFGHEASGKATLEGAFDLKRQHGASATNQVDTLAGKTKGAFDFAMDGQLQPKSVKGNLDLNLGEASGAFASYKNYGGELAVEMTPTDLKQLAARLAQNGKTLAEVKAHGPLDLERKEGRLIVEATSIDRQVLNLFGAMRGWDFAETKLSSSNVVNLAQKGTIATFSGSLKANDAKIVHGKEATPAVDFDLDYNLQLSFNEQLAVLHRLNMDGRQNGGELIQANLDKPMTLTWGEKSRGFTESNFQLAVTNFTLADWGLFLGTNIPNGIVSFRLAMSAQRDGKSLKPVIAGRIRDLGARWGTNAIEKGDLIFDVDAQVDDLKLVRIQKGRFELSQNQQMVARGEGSGSINLERDDANLQLAVEGNLPALLKINPVPDLQARSGAVQLNAFLTQQSGKKKATGNAQLANFTGNHGTYAFNAHEFAMDYNVELTEELITLHRISLSISRNYNAGGSVTLNGKYFPKDKNTQINFQLLDLNENALHPFLQASLGQKQLASVALKGGGTAQYHANGDAALTASVQVTNLVVIDPAQKATATPLSANLELDGGLKQKALDLKKCLLGLTPTTRASNKLQLEGRLDLSQTNAAAGQFALRSEGLDLTDYYNIFSGATNQAAAAAAPAQTEPAKEPDAVSLPIKDLAADLKIDRLYLRHVAVTDFVANARIAGSQINLKPIGLNLNGGPVAAEAAVDLGVAGYRYDLTFKGENIPLQPLADTFSSGSTGRLQGTLVFSGAVKGQGITEASWRRSLNSDMNLLLTNMEYQILGPKVRKVFDPIARILQLPELTQTPINWVSTDAGVTNGSILLNAFKVESGAFHAESKGVIPMADKLTNSVLNLPVQLAIRRSLAEKAKLVPANAPTNTAYVQLPTFVSLKGTIGEPKSDINELVISGLVLQSAGGLGKALGQETGDVLQNVGGLLSGQKTTPGGTNAPSTNKPSGAAILQGLGDALLRPKTTNAPGTNAPGTNKPAKVNPLDLLRGLQKK